MTSLGYGCAFGGGTIINAIASWKGCAYATELKTYAEVNLINNRHLLSEESGRIVGKNYDNPNTDTQLIELCVESVFDRFDCRQNASVFTKSSIPVAGGLKSSSAAANACILAALDAIGAEMPAEEIVQMGVSAAKKAGVTITGAYDDACASFYGGVAVTDNKKMRLLKQEDFFYDVLILNPGTQAFSSQTNVSHSRLISDLIDTAFEMALAGDYKKAMKLNGLLYCGVLGFDSAPAISCMEIGKDFGVVCGLSGTGPSFTALFPENQILTDSEKKESDAIKKEIAACWKALYPAGLILETKTCNRSALEESGRFSNFMKAEKIDLSKLKCGEKNCKKI
jgi:shikimate kinase